jgi:hypothetical protein
LSVENDTESLVQFPLTWLLCEGETEEIFYSLLRPLYFNDIPVRIRDIHGGGNFLKATLAIAGEPFTPTGQTVRIYCCVDNEAKYETVPDFDIEAIRYACRKENMANILSVDAIVANQMTESWFFYDLPGILDFLNVPQEDRSNLPSKCQAPTNCRLGVIKKLFQDYGQYYREGKKSKSFIESLNLRKIVSGCEELREGIEKIKKQANNLSSHLF